MSGFELPSECSKPCNDGITMFIAIKVRFAIERRRKIHSHTTSNESSSLTRAATNDADIVVCGAPLQYLLSLVGEKLQANYTYGKVGRSGELCLMSTCYHIHVYNCAGTRQNAKFCRNSHVLCSAEYCWSQAQALNTHGVSQRHALGSSLILLCNRIRCTSRIHRAVTMLTLLL